MSDSKLTNNTNFSQNQNTGSSQNLKGRVVDAGSEMKQRAGDAMSEFKEAADAAKDVSSGTADQLQSEAREKHRSGADFIERFAGNIRKAARAFENDAPFAARGIDSAAEYVEDAAEKIRNGSFRDVVDNATDFAKRQPAAFLGISVLAGFAVVRFLKASESGASSSSRSDTNQASSSRRADAWTSSAPGSSSEHFSRPQRSSSSQRGDVS